jgi:cell division protein FtsB
MRVFIVGLLVVVKQRDRPRRHQRASGLLSSRSVSPRRRIKGLLFLVFLIAAAYEFVGGDYGVYRIRNQRRQIELLKAEVQKMRADNEALRRHVALLENDPATIEKIARERYGMAKPGETVYMVYDRNQAERKKP